MSSGNVRIPQELELKIKEMLSRKELKFENILTLEKFIQRLRLKKLRLHFQQFLDLELVDSEMNMFLNKRKKNQNLIIR